MAGFLSELPQVVENLGSKDKPSRRMAVVFLVSVAGLITTIVIGVVQFFSRSSDAPVQLSLVEQDAKKISDFVQKQVDLSKQRASFLQLGTFTIELKSVPGSRPTRGVLNMAEVEIFVQCDEAKTRDFLFAHQAQMRDHVTRVIPVMDREELLTREGKKLIKNRIRKELNEWIPSGEIIDVHFSRLMIN